MLPVFLIIKPIFLVVFANRSKESKFENNIVKICEDDSKNMLLDATDDFYLKNYLACKFNDLSRYLHNNNTESPFENQKLRQELKTKILIQYFRISFENLKNLFFVSDHENKNLRKFNTIDAYDFVKSKLIYFDLYLFQNEKPNSFLVDKFNNIYSQSESKQDELKQNPEESKKNNHLKYKEFSYKERKKLMITLIFNSIIYFVIDNFINLISDTKESFMCVFYFNNVKQNFNNQYVTIIEYKPVYLLNKYECLLLNSRNFEIQDIIASIENFVLLLKKDESKCLEKNVLEIIQLYIIDLIYNIFVSFNPTKNYQYIMEEFVKQKICYEQINYMNENLWNEIKKLIFMIDTWHEDKNCNFNHKFYIYGKEIKRFKWLIKFNSPFEIYIKENKLCIISSMSKIGAFFTWEDQVFVMGNTNIEENTFVGSNTIIFFLVKLVKMSLLEKIIFFTQELLF